MCFKGFCRHKLRGFDIFGAPVGVTFNGASTHQTALGGTVTLFLLSIIAGSLLFELVLLIQGNYSVKMTETETQFSADSDKIVMSTQT